MKWLTALFKIFLSSKTVALLGFAGVILGGISNPEFSTFIPANIAAWAVTVGGIVTTLTRGLVDTNANGIPDLFEFFTGTPATKDRLKRENGYASTRLLAGILLFAALGLVAMACGKAAAQPRATMVLADARVGAVCSGPASMTGCLISLHDSTANISLASNVAVVRGDTLWRTRPCLAIETVVIGGQFIGTRPGATNSAPVGARGTGACTAQAGQPSPVIVIQVTP